MKEPHNQKNQWILQARDKIVPLVKISSTATQFLDFFFKFTQDYSIGTKMPGPQFMIMLFPWSYKPKQHWESPICSKRIHQSKAKVAFSCLDCRYCDNSILCYECFSQSDHVGHKYLQFQTSGGCCDCGDDQAWSQKGFCPNHGQNLSGREVQKELSEIFCKEIQLAFYMYFWLISNRQNKKFLRAICQMYGEILLGSIADMVESEYQLKVLLNQVLRGGFGDLPKLSESNMSIIERFFQLQSCGQLFFLNKVAIQLFPVVQFRSFYIKIYLKSTYQLKIPFSHPFKELNYQYMGRAKLMSELIAAGQLKPMLLRKNLELNSKDLNDLFDKYLDDLTYVLKPQSAILYLRLHFKIVNICDMMWYRELTRYDGQQDFRKVKIDECFLKVLSEILKIIKKQRHTLEKIMKELFQYITHNKHESTSLIHQRAFAMVCFLYIDCNLQNLTKPVGQNLRNLLNLGRADTVIYNLIKIFLKARIKSQLAFKGIYLKESQFKHNINSNSPQKNVQASLDMLYIKLLLLISQRQINYSSIVEQTLISLSEDKSSLSLFDLTFFSVEIFTNDMDELAISNLLGMMDNERFFCFMRRISKNMKDLSAKEIKVLASMLIPNSQLIDIFLGTKVKLQRGKILSNFNDPPFDTLLFRKFIGLSGIELFKLELHLFKNINKIKLFEDVAIYNDNTISIIKNEIEKQFKQYVSQEDIQHQSQPEAEEIMREIIIMFAETKNERVKQIYNKFSSQEKFMKNVSREMLSQASLFFKDEVNTEDIINLKEGQSAKKRQNLVRKRKQKEELMKKKQMDMLKLYDLQDSNESQAQTCIYCKESNNKNCYLISYCGLTNLYEQKCLKNSDIHVFLQTCGHQIHQQCFLNYLSEKNEMRFCFLCKKQTNILVPSLPALNNAEFSSKIISQFKSILFPTLLRNFEHQEQLIESLMNINYSQIYILIQSFVRQIVLFSLYYPKSLLKEIYNVYRSIYAIIKNEQKGIVKQCLQKLKLILANSKLESQAGRRQSLVIKLLQRKFIQKQSQLKNSNISEDAATQEFLQNIIELYDTNTFSSSYKYDLPQAKEPIVNIMPQEVLNLLPPKPQCGLCKKLTNRLLSCLICDWIGCQSDDDCMKKHTKDKHPDGAIFIFLLNGQIIYSSSSQNLFVISSIYEDFLGESLSHQKGVFSKQKLAKYHLNGSRFEQLKKCIVHRTIHNNIQ